MRIFQYAQLVPSNKGGIINDCPLSMTNKGQWINIAKINPNESMPALIPLDRPKNELTPCDKLID